MSELASTIREALAALAAGDRSLRRFGAARHRYRLAAPIEAPVDYPDDLSAFMREVGSGGAGPYYGLLSLAEPTLVASPTGAPWTEGVAVAHMGCGYAAVVALDGDARGQVWIDARAVGVARPIHQSFTAYYLDWIDRLAHGAWPEAWVPPTACPLPNALGGFLAVQEQRLGIEPGTLAGAALREALAELGSHSIEIAAESSVLFANGTRVDPCIACARLVENLGADGLRPDVVAPGDPL